MSEDKGWSHAVTHRVPATFPPYGLYTKGAEDIYRSMRRPDVSPRGLASAISMCQFYINRAGRILPESRKSELKKAISLLQTELRYRNSQAGKKTPGSPEQHEADWQRLMSEIDLTGEPEPAMGPNPYLANIAAMQQEKMEAKALGLKKFASIPGMTEMKPINTEAHPVANVAKMVSGAKAMNTKMLRGEGKDLQVGGKPNRFLNKVAALLSLT